MLHLTTFLLTAGCAIAQIPPQGVQNWVSPAYNDLYQYPVPIPTIKAPKRTYTSPNGSVIDYFEIDIKPLEQQIYPNLGKTRLVGYDGLSPGPTFVVQKGREAVVRFINHGDRASAVHLHGANTRAPFDGWAEDVINVGQYKDYYYPNAQSGRTLWDHTAENALFGQAGFYIMNDPDESNIANIPQGKYDIALGLSSKRYLSNGQLWSPEANNEVNSMFGDVIQVNGQPWPYLKVEPRKYRLRFCNTALSRSFQMYFENESGAKQQFNFIGSDSGLMTKPVLSNQMDLSMGERWEVVFDFAAFQGKNVTLRNNRAVGVDTDYVHTDKVMRFVVGTTVSDKSNNGALPATLRDVPFPPSKTTVDRTFNFLRDGNGWNINGIGWNDGPESRVIAKPPRGKVEVWDLVSNNGPWTHPVHVHMVDFQIISRTGGRGQVTPAEKAALKDVVWLNRGERVRVIARFAPWDGLYMFHCHNLIHEDHEMMAAVNITALTDLGYKETTRFLDPMEARYRAKIFNANAFSARTGVFSNKQIDAKCKFFDELNAYRDMDDVDQALDDYWSTHTRRRRARRAITTADLI